MRRRQSHLRSHYSGLFGRACAWYRQCRARLARGPRFTHSSDPSSSLWRSNSRQSRLSLRWVTSARCGGQHAVLSAAPWLSTPQGRTSLALCRGSPGVFHSAHSPARERCTRGCVSPSSLCRWPRHPKEHIAKLGRRYLCAQACGSSSRSSHKGGSSGCQGRFSSRACTTMSLH